LVTMAAGGAALFDTATGARVDIDRACRGDLLAVSPQGAVMALLSADDHTVTVCDVATGSLGARARLPVKLAVTAIAVDDVGQVALGEAAGMVTLLTPSANGTTMTGRAVDVRSGQEPAEVRSVSIRNGVVAAGIRAPATRGAQATVLIWPVDGTPIQFVTDFLDVPSVVLLGPNAGAVVVAGRDAPDSPVVLQTWETATRRRLGHPFSGLVGDAISLGGDTTSVVGTDTTGAVFRWHSATTAADEICAIVARPLRRDEWDSALSGALRRYSFIPVCEPP
jgi:hypothetical protein